MGKKDKKRPKAPEAKRLSPQQFSDVVDAHQTRMESGVPARARRALLAGPVEVCGITIHPPTIGAVTLLQEIDSPIFHALTTGEEKPLGLRDITSVIFIYAEPLKANAALQQGVEAFREAAFAWTNERLTMDKFPKVMEVIHDMGRAVQKSSPVLEGATESEDKDPLAPSPTKGRG